MLTLIRLASILLLAVVCCRAPRADEYSGTRAHAIESRASATVEDQTAETASERTRRISVLPRLTRAQTAHDEQPAIKLSEPPGLQRAEASTTDIWAKWADLQSRIQSEEETLAACRAGSPIVLQPHASSCRSLNLAGSGKVALGWARSIAR